MEEGRLGLNWLRKASEKGHRDAAYAVQTPTDSDAAVSLYPTQWSPTVPPAQDGLGTAPLALALSSVPS